MAKTSKSAKKDSSATIGFEAKIIKVEQYYAGANPRAPDKYKNGFVLLVPATTKNAQSIWHCL